MDVSSFMTGYFVGLVAGAGIFVWWTYKFGRFLPKVWPFTWRRIANFLKRLAGIKPKEVTFSTRRGSGAITPAE